MCQYLHLQGSFWLFYQYFWIAFFCFEFQWIGLGAQPFSWRFTKKRKKEKKRKKKEWLAQDVLDTFSAHVGLVIDVNDTNCVVQNGSIPGRIFTTF